MAVEKHSNVTVANQALIGMGEKPITAFSDENDRARTIKQTYFQARQYMLSINDWQFPKVFGFQLSRDTETPVTRWTYQFTLPPDRLTDDMRAVYTDNVVGAIPIRTGFHIMGQKLLTDHTEIYVDYIADKDESEWPPYFVAAVKDYFGWQIAVPMTDQETTAARFKEAYQGTNERPGSLDIAKSLDAQPGQVDIVQSSPFIEARHGGVQGGSYW